MENFGQNKNNYEECSIEYKESNRYGNKLPLVCVNGGYIRSQNIEDIL